MTSAQIVMLTALEVEYRAVRAHLADIIDAPHPAGTRFEIGTLSPSSRRVVIGLTGPGNTNAAVVAERAIAMYSPQAMFFVGIAGALHADLDLGDIVFATKVYAYQGGRADDQGFHAAPEVWHPAHELEQVARHLDRTNGWRARLSGAMAGSVYFRPVAAGDVVLNSASHPLREQLNQHYVDAAAIEMESAGAARAGQLNRSLAVSTIRGISDRADGLKYVTDAGGHQAFAMAGAAAFAVDVADRTPLQAAEPAQPAGPAMAAGSAAPTNQQNITSLGGLAAGALGGNVYVYRDGLSEPPDAAPRRG